VDEVLFAQIILLLIRPLRLSTEPESNMPPAGLSG
jgi:hypothetical protein